MLFEDMLLRRSGKLFSYDLGLEDLERRTSSGFFCRSLARALEPSPSVGEMVLLDPARWPETWVRRFCAVIDWIVSLAFIPEELGVY